MVRALGESGPAVLLLPGGAESVDGFFPGIADGLLAAMDRALGLDFAQLGRAADGLAPIAAGLRESDPRVPAVVVPADRKPGAGMRQASRDGPGLPGTGCGLTGLRERVEQQGGRLQAGPTPTGGWLVRAVLPG